MGVKRAFITLGERGACAMEGDAFVHLPGGPVRMVNATGAGDAFTAALAWSAASRQDIGLEDQLRFGLAAASIALEAESTVNPAMSRELLMSRAASLQ